MSNASEIREFLTSRRAKISPERAGLPVYGRQRRVAGLRREEVALLAGISVEYYTRLERGNARGVSESLLEAVSQALQLDEAEHAHLLDPARTANLERPPRRTAEPERVRPSVARLVDALAGIPAYVRNGRLDIVYANDLAKALFSDLFRDGVRPANHARFVFLDPRARTFWVDDEKAAHDTVAVLRSEAGRNPYDRALSDLIGELSTRSEEFRVRWATHDVRFHRTGTKQIRHPLVGELTLAFEALELPADAGLSLLTYSAEPGSASERALDELAGWNSTRTRLAAVHAESKG
ncbi:MAG: helix-turn-helix domain-containing protein [Candidatus Limnocylindria bacterium]